MDLETRLRSLLADAEAVGLLRSPQAYEAQSPLVSQGTTRLLSFASNDYLGLSEHPTLRSALAAGALTQAGTGSSPVVAGTSPAHRLAEATLAEYARLPAARLFSSAYAANLAVLGSLFGPGDLLLSDSLNHASLIDGCRLSRARVLVYRHGDHDHLRALLQEHRASARVTAIVTETAFSMDGDIAEMAGLQRIASDHATALVVDEAHALGVIGPAGSGVCAHVGVCPEVLVGGLGKSFGMAGGFVAGSSALARAIDNFGRSFVFSTAILPAIAHAIPTSVNLVRDANAARETLQAHAAAIRAAADRAKRSVLGQAPGVIVPVLLGSPDEAMQVASLLRATGILVPAMRPPTVAPGTSRLRITPTALHTPEHVAQLCDALTRALS